MSKKKLKPFKPFKHQPKQQKIIETDLALSFIIKTPFKLTPSQQEFIDVSSNKDTNIMICDGPAGTSKTYCAVNVALKMLQAKEVENIIYVRSIVESAARKLGSLPGEVDDKFKPWILPFLEKCDELIEPYVTDSLIKDEHISCVPVNFLRGTTFKNCAVIVDEAQNLEMSEIITILTRFGINCKMFIIGDTLQSDINKSCFKSIFNTFSDNKSIENGIRTFKFTEDDILRSKILKFIINKVSNLK